MTEKSKNADASKLESGVSTVKSFRYYMGWCFVTLTNGVTGIVGDSTTFHFQAMLSLKGSGQQVRYMELKPRADSEYKRYSLEWSVE